ncbi:hypothetical protein EDB83DRAFT_2316082 [Lactarius deliciosus]|nr:hypothetical protein EDB83DRAFT_2316082 [Lactarius deliciosus]
MRRNHTYKPLRPQTFYQFSTTLTLTPTTSISFSIYKTSSARQGVLNGLENTLKPEAGAPMGQVMKDTYEKAAQVVWHHGRSRCWALGSSVLLKSTYNGYVPAGSLFSFFQRLGMVKRYSDMAKNMTFRRDRRNLIFPDGKKSTRFADNVFIKRPIKIEPLNMEDYEKHGSESGRKLIVDSQTERWPVPDHFRRYLDQISFVEPTAG